MVEVTEPEQLNGKYIIERRIGRGGMGEVSAGRMIGVEGFSHPVAIKRIHSDYSADHERRSWLVTEARLMGRLRHSNIVSVYDLQEDEHGRLFLVMELVDGSDLMGLLRTGLLPLPLVLFVTCEILRGLGHAHDLPGSDDPVRGLVHRDVSPQNVLIGWDGAVKVSDFGLAKAREATKASASILVKGKPAYMSPEQANSIALDGRSDLFSVGVMLWEMICGARLFARDSIHATMKSVLFDPIPAPRSLRPDLPGDIERITMRLLEKDRERRYRDADAAIAALAACASYPKNGRELLSALLRERLPTRAPLRRSPPLEAAGAVLSEEPVTAPRVEPLLEQHVDPFRVLQRRSRARRIVPLGLLGIAAALVASLAVGSSSHTDSDGAPASPLPRAAPTAEQPVSRPPSAARAITVISVPPERAKNRAPDAPAPQDYSARAAASRARAKSPASAAESPTRGQIHVIKLGGTSQPVAPETTPVEAIDRR